MNTSRVTAPGLVVLATLGALSPTLVGAHPASASATSAVGSRPDDKLRESIEVTGTGEVFGEPDTLSATFAVETVATTVDAALAGAVAAATRMRDSFVRAGIARADLQTSNVDVSSRQNDDQKITGYTVNQGLTVKIRNLPRAGALMSAAIAAGGDAARLNGVSFTIENDDALLAEARRKAFADARAKAELYAREAGRPLGRVVNVSEAVPGYREPAEQKHMAAADSIVPIEPGRQRLAVTVTVEWALQTTAATAKPAPAKPQSAKPEPAKPGTVRSAP